MRDILDQACEESKELAILAGEKIMQIYAKNFDVEYKSDSSPVTEADKASNELISRGLKSRFPNMAILAEESEDDLSRLENDWCFLVDPLDGTKEFVKKNDEFSVNIALSYNGESVMGVVYLPVSDKMYWAVKGGGAYVKESEGAKRIIKASDKLDDLTLTVSRSHMTDKEKELIEKHGIKNVLRVGSAIKGCLVAEGAADIYYRFSKCMQWDTAAMQIVAEEAGCIFRQMDGTYMRYNRRGLVNDKGFFIVNRKENIFEDMLDGEIEQ